MQACNLTGNTDRKTLFYLLIMLMEGRALASPENCKTGEGLELWPKLVEACEPKAGKRAAGFLVKILTAEFDMSDFLNSLEKCVNVIKQHDAMVDELEGVKDRVKIATLISRMGKGIVHFLVGVAKYTRYDQLRKDLVEYLSAKKPLCGDSSGVSGGGGPTPTEIGMAKRQNGKRQHEQPRGAGEIAQEDETRVGLRSKLVHSGQRNRMVDFCTLTSFFIKA